MAQRSLQEIRADFIRGLREGLDEVAEAFVDEATTIIEAEAVDQGTLKNSVEVRKPAQLRRVVSWTAEHAPYVHWGTRPHWPPLAPILAWVRRNLATVIYTSGERETRIKPGTGARTVKAPDAEILRVARAVQAKIARDGTAPVPWVPRALSRVEPRVPGILAEAVRRNRR